MDRAARAAPSVPVAERRGRVDNTSVRKPDTNSTSKSLATNQALGRSLNLALNVPFHKATGVQEAIEAGGATLRYPAHSILQISIQLRWFFIR
jgi:hypothetical protein